MLGLVKFCMLYFVLTIILRVAPFPYYRRIKTVAFRIIPGWINAYFEQNLLHMNTIFLLIF